MSKKQNKWAMPEWMEPYRVLFNNTGGNTVEECMNRKDVTVFNNAPMALICVAVEAQVGLLMSLYDKGKLV